MDEVRNLGMVSAPNIFSWLILFTRAQAYLNVASKRPPPSSLLGDQRVPWLGNCRVSAITVSQLVQVPTSLFTVRGRGGDSKGMLLRCLALVEQCGCDEWGYLVDESKGNDGK